MAGQELLGRARELGRIAALLDDARAGRGGALLLEGPAGIGKSALVLAARSTADVLVLSATGVAARGEGGFSALHELLHPVLEQTARLPDRQAAALEVALGLRDGPTPEPLVIGTAVLGLLQNVADDRPLLVVVDDLHWCDVSSIEILGLLATRLTGSRIALLASIRDDPEYAAGAARFADRVVLQPLEPSAAEALVDDVLEQVGRGARARVLQQAEGNPLALVELSARATEPHGEADRSRVAVTRRIENAFLAEVRQLPEHARRALVLVAAGVGDERDEVLRAAEAMGIRRDSIGLAEQAGLLRGSVDGDRFAFRHPLVGSALLSSAGMAGARSEHLALAQVVRDDARRAWHRAEAAAGWDEAAAEDLEAVALAAARRGARAEAVVAAERAAELTQDPRARGRRLVLAAEVARQAGRSDDAIRLLDLARRLDADVSTAKDLASVEWLLALTVGTPTRGLAGYLRLADSVADPDDRADVLLWAATLCYLMAQPQDLRRVVTDELEQLPESSTRAIGLALVGRPVPTIRIEDLAGEVDVTDAVGAVVLNLLAFVAEDHADLAAALLCWDTAVRAHALAGRPADEATAMAGRGTVRMIADNLDGAQEDLQQALRLSSELGLPVVLALSHASLACVLAARGELQDARALLAAVVDLPAPPRVAAIAAWGEGSVATAEHRYDDAVDALLATEINPPIALWAQAQLADVAQRAGRRDVAMPWIARATELSEETASPRLRLALLDTEGVVGAERSEERFAAALAAGRSPGDEIAFARVRLHLGEWLRRERRVAAAREQLAAALDAFLPAGFGPLAERTAEELRAAGATATADPVPRAASALTGQELHIGRLAASGLSNREIADRLYLSVATVNTHLRSAFAKLGVGRRTQLAGLLGTAGSVSTAAS